MSEDEFKLPPLGGSDLSLVPLADLVSAIQDRVKSSVICLETKEELPQGACTYSGGYFTALGLLESYKSDLLHFDLENMTTEEEP